MLLIEIVEEIQERSTKSLSMPSIIRKINQVKNNIKRMHSTGVEVSRLDLEPNLSTYPLPCPAGSIVEVLINGARYPQQGLQEHGHSRYYSILDKTLVILPTPTEAITRGLTIFHKTSSRALTVGDLNAEPDMDPDYHMLLVWGVLQETTAGAEAADYKARYDMLLPDYVIANQAPAATQIRLEEW